MHVAPARSLITPRSAVRIAGMVRVAPAVDLADVVEQHWIVAWDHRDRPPVTQEVLPDPCVNLAIEPAGVLIYGVTSGRSTHVLAGAGTVVGTKFRPGGFSGFVAEPVRALNDRVLTPAEAFGADGSRLERALAGAATTSTLIDLVTAFVRVHRPPTDPRRALVAEIVQAMRAAPPGTRVAEIAARFNLAPRTLQRVFATHVGATQSVSCSASATRRRPIDYTPRTAATRASRAWPQSWATSIRPTSSTTSAPLRDDSRPRSPAPEPRSPLVLPPTARFPGGGAQCGRFIARRFPLPLSYIRARRSTSPLRTCSGPRSPQSSAGRLSG